MSAETEELRGDIERVIDNYPRLTVCETVGVLELVKLGIVERLRTSDGNERTDKPKPDLK